MPPINIREELQMIVELLRRHSGDECGNFPAIFNKRKVRISLLLTKRFEPAKIYHGFVT